MSVAVATYIMHWVLYLQLISVQERYDSEGKISTFHASWEIREYLEMNKFQYDVT
jgi:hypothetical protein